MKSNTYTYFQTDQYLSMRITPILSRYSKQWIASRTLIRNELYSNSIFRISTFRTWDSYSRNMSSAGPIPKEEITKRVLNVLKSFEKVDKTKVIILYIYCTRIHSLFNS